MLHWEGFGDAVTIDATFATQVRISWTSRVIAPGVFTGEARLRSHHKCNIITQSRFLPHAWHGANSCKRGSTTPK